MVKDKVMAGLSDALEEAVSAGVPEHQLMVQKIPIELIVAGDNDRKQFEQKALNELASSIMENGLLQPITLRQVGIDLYQLIAGERRFRAWCLLAQAQHNEKWDRIPALVHEVDDAQASALMLVENTARQNLDPVSEARAYQKRLVCLGWDTERIARVAGVGVQRVKNRLELLKLRDDVLELIASNSLDPQYGVIMAGMGLDANYQGLALRAFNNAVSPNLSWWRSTCSQLLEQQATSSMFGLFAMTEEIQAIVDAPAILPPTVETYRPSRTPKNALNLLGVMIRECRDHAAKWDKLGSYKERNKFSAAADKLEQALKLLEAASVPQVKAKVA